MRTDLRDSDSKPGDNDNNVRFGWWAFGKYALGVTAVALAGRASMRGRRGPGAWYRLLAKPKGQPPSWVFGPVWTTLYTLMAWSATRVSGAPESAARSRALQLWWAQLALNGLWTPIFFGAHRPKLALMDIGVLGVSMAAYTSKARQVDPMAAWLFAPALAWVGYASWLNAGIVQKNRVL